MSAPRRVPFQPAILTAHDLASGVPLVWTADAAWSHDPAHAHLFDSADAAQDALAMAALQGTRIVGPYMVAAAATPAGPRPHDFRERIRLTGPTLRYL